MNVDIIIPIWDQPDITSECIKHVIKNTDYPYRLMLIDNGSAQPTKQLLEEFKAAYDSNIVLIRNESNLGFIKAVNQGLRLSNAPYVCILNNDTRPSPGWLNRLVEFAEQHGDIGLVNPVCDANPDISMNMHAELARKNKDKYLELNQCFLFATLIKRAVIEKVGFLDEMFGMGCLEDADYSIRAAAAGYRCAMLYSSYVDHVHGISFKALGRRSDIVAENEVKFFKKWPRHIRIGIGLSLEKNTNDIRLENVLRGALFLAREWSWVNIWLFGDRKSMIAKVSAVAANIDMPDHQNIKFNYLPGFFKSIYLLGKLLERSFGSKRRKRYDVLFVDNIKTSKFLSSFHKIHHADTETVDFQEEAVSYLRKVIYKHRGMCIQT